MWTSIWKLYENEPLSTQYNHILLQGKLLHQHQSASYLLCSLIWTALGQEGWNDGPEHTSLWLDKIDCPELLSNSNPCVSWISVNLCYINGYLWKCPQKYLFSLNVPYYCLFMYSEKTQNNKIRLDMDNWVSAYYIYNLLSI